MGNSKNEKISMSLAEFTQVFHHQVVSAGNYPDFNIFPIHYDVVDLSNFISDKLSALFDWVAGKIDFLNNYFDIMWNKLGLEAFADVIINQAESWINNVAPVLLKQTAKLAST